jgi:threonine 3-dehydrogenase
MAILVTGASGYIGRFLVNELVEQGHDVVAVDLREPPEGLPPGLPSEARFVTADVADKAAMLELARREPFSAVIHLAGIVTMGCEQDPDAAMRVNVGGTANLLEAARLAEVPGFVFASTISVYGPDATQPMVEEKTPAEPRTWYGQTKLMGEQLGLYYRRRWGLDFRAARLAAIVGPARVAAGSATMYTSLILEKAALGEPYEIDVDPEAGTPVLYVRDAARGLAALATTKSVPRRVYHLSTGLATVEDLLRIARARVPDAQLTFNTDPQLGPVSKISAGWDLSIEAAEKDLGWRPSFTIESMADDLMAAARARRS